MPPGNYLVVALESIGREDWLHADFLEDMSRRAGSFKVPDADGRSGAIDLMVRLTKR
jgi:hypothetical protein